MRSTKASIWWRENWSPWNWSRPSNRNRSSRWRWPFSNACKVRVCYQYDESASIIEGLNLSLQARNTCAVSSAAAGTTGSTMWWCSCRGATWPNWGGPSRGAPSLCRPACVWACRSSKPSKAFTKSVSSIGTSNPWVSHCYSLCIVQDLMLINVVSISSLSIHYLLLTLLYRTFD